MFVLLDGGMGRELQRIGAPFSQPLWSAQALIEAPEFVSQAHKNFIEAGCDVITVNSYACVPFHLGDELYQRQGAALAEKAAKIARVAVQESAPHMEDIGSVKVAGCIPPVLGSYRPDLFDAEKATPILNTLIDAQEAHVDFWIAETIGSIAEFNTMFAALGRSNKPAFFAFSLLESDTDIPRLRSGEPVEDAVQRVCELNVDGILFNCSQPEVMLGAIEVAKHNIDALGANISLGAYANGFTVIQDAHEANNTLTTVRDLSSGEYAEFVQSWLDAGSNVVGGCCAIYPEHIKRLDGLRK
ncbi:homocysteine methyltransferase [Enterovibrio norvegicus]|uniref:homocysteine S-methyltransferase family protein n=1 Tax=Enterovibrio norvegicus TaxID=188144 RepID=UPI000C857A89|nr:homocysteine S-methyltransferase family protein [Enterovibrio norvegicus]MCC4800643.1 homocysteine S-methyltransferase family protein [Enterovibrio norvegicus]PMI38571.1 homocysteine methyltransferase [Enterovibrio norvegicus]PMN51838.1 homocysteine methyltransferase [Enterovibrio norvegicus]